LWKNARKIDIRQYNRPGSCYGLAICALTVCKEYVPKKASLVLLNLA
jgi:hypothetical protein